MYLRTLRGMLNLLGLLLAAALAHSQDPYLTAPSNYTLELDNEYVRISRAKFSPGDKVPVHSHPSIPTIYVYLDDGGPIRFSHQTPKFSIERPAVTAGGVRFNRNAQVETHEVEYLGSAPTEYLRIELKTPPAPPHRDARLRSAADFPWEDAQVRIGRIVGKPERPSRRAVFVDVSARSFTWFDPKNAGATKMPADSQLLVAIELK